MPFTWTAPNTWLAGDTPDYNDMNEISENLRFLHTKDKVHAYRSTDEAVADSTWELLNWDSEDYDNNSMHSNVTNNGRLSCQSDGAYLVNFKVNFATNTTGIRRVMLRKNSGGSDSGGTHLGTWNEDGIATENTSVHGGRVVVLSTGGTNDYVELFAYQTSGGSLDVKSGANVSYFQMMQLTG
jgi:hypothetical protein